MAVLQEFNKLSFQNPAEENDFVGYCAEIISDELAGKVPYNQIIIPEKNVKAYVLLMYIFPTQWCILFPLP